MCVVHLFSLHLGTIEKLTAVAAVTDSAAETSNLAGANSKHNSLTKQGCYVETNDNHSRLKLKQLHSSIPSTSRLPSLQ
jgi:hypothetical protein